MRKYIKRTKNFLSLRARAIKQYLESKNYNPSYQEALEELERFSPNPHTSCYCAESDFNSGGDTTYRLLFLLTTMKNYCLIA